MKRIIMFVLLFAALKVAGQTTGYLRFDTVKIMKQNGTCELYVINKTKDSLGLLTNVGGGLTQFIKPKVLNDSAIVVGLDTLIIRGIGGGGSGSATLSNVGSGYRLVKTADGQVKTIFVGYGLDADSTTNTNAITIKADTSELVTPSDLADAIAGGGSSGDITSNVFKDSSFVPLIVIFGESNASGVGDNTFASAGEIDADPRVQIMQLSGQFQSLDISSNNNITESTGFHGLELELQNQIATYFNNRTVYMVKAGKGGSTISQWQIGTANYDTLVTRMNNAITRLNELGKIPVICVWYTQGINDAVAGTDETTWSNSTLSLFNNFRQRFGYCPIMMTQLIGDRVTYPKFDLIDAKILDLARDKSNYIFRIPTPQSPEGSSSTDSIQTGGVHWEYVGLKAITQRMLKAMVDTAGYINYDRRIRFANLNAWQLTGNTGTNPATHAIGTNDTAQVIFKQNGLERMRIYSNGYLGIGKFPSFILDVNGDAAINGLRLGRGAGNEVSNIAFGANALGANTSGSVNAAIGGSSLRSNTSGFGNVGVGYQTLDANATGNANVAIGFQTLINTTGGFNIGIGSQAGGSWFTSQSNKLVIHNGGTGALIYGDMSTGQLQINSASTPSLTASAALEVISTARGFLTPVMTAAQRIAISSPATGLEVFDTDSLRKMMYNGSAWKAVAWTTDVAGGADGNGIYGGNGTLPSDVTVTGANNSITFNDIFAHRINSDYNVIAKANATGNYTEAVIGAGNQYWIGYTPVAGTFGKGAGIVIDTNENVGIGAPPPTTIPLYATGASFFVQGLQSNQGNFMRVDNVATTGSLGLTNYFVTIDATAGSVTLTLPAASTAFGNSMGIKYVVQRIDNSGNTITIQRAGSDTINGTTSFTLGTQWESKNIQCTSTSTWAQH